MGRLGEKELESLKKAVENSISREDFRKVVFEAKRKEIVERYTSQLKHFESFLHFFRQPFTRYEYLTEQPRYVAHSSCIGPLLEDKALEKKKYFVERGEERILQANIKIDLNDFTKIFRHLSQHFGLSNLENELENNLNLELKHFSELYLEENLEKR